MWCGFPVREHLFAYSFMTYTLYTWATLKYIIYLRLLEMNMLDVWICMDIIVHRITNKSIIRMQDTLCHSVYPYYK